MSESSASASITNAGGVDRDTSRTRFSTEISRSIPIPTKTEDGGASTSPKRNARDAFSIYSNDRVRLNVLLDLNDESIGEHVGREAERANGDDGNGDNDQAGANEEEENQRRRKTRLSWEVHVNTLFSRWFLGDE